MSPCIEIMWGNAPSAFITFALNKPQGWQMVEHREGKQDLLELKSICYCLSQAFFFSNSLVLHQQYPHLHSRVSMGLHTVAQWVSPTPPKSVSPEWKWYLLWEGRLVSDSSRITLVRYLLKEAVASVLSIVVLRRSRLLLPLEGVRTLWHFEPSLAELGPAVQLSHIKSFISQPF